MDRWIVYWDGRIITEVYFTAGLDAEYVRQSLIDHDGLPSDITIRRITI